MSGDWLKEFSGSVIVCDRAGIIVEMNDRAIAAYSAEGGAALIGRNVLDCHPQPARDQLQDMLATGRANIYTVERKGRRKLIYQAPWSVKGEYAGFVELSLEIPAELPHYVRTP